MVTGRALKAALIVTQFDLKWGRAPGKYQRFGGLFIYNSPDLEERLQRAERTKVEAQQRAIQLDQCTITTIPNAWVVTFDGGFRRNKELGKGGLGGSGWLVWNVVNDHWKLVRAEGHFTLDATTVNIEEFKGVKIALAFVATLPACPILVFGDSKLVIGALQGKLQCQ